MKRLLLTFAIVVLAVAAWRAYQPFRIKHPVSGKEITVPGPNGPNAVLVSGWKTTPKAQVASNDVTVGKIVEAITKSSGPASRVT